MGPVETKLPEHAIWCAQARELETLGAVEIYADHFVSADEGIPLTVTPIIHLARCKMGPANA